MTGNDAAREPLQNKPMPYLVWGSVRIVPGDIYTDKGGTTVRISGVRYDANNHGRVTTVETTGSYHDEWFAGDVADYIMRGVWQKVEDTA